MGFACNLYTLIFQDDVKGDWPPSVPEGGVISFRSEVRWGWQGVNLVLDYVSHVARGRNWCESESGFGEINQSPVTILG